MSSTQTMDSVAVANRIGTRSNVHRIESTNLKSCYRNMGSGRIISNTIWFLTQKHRVGLLMLSTLLLLGYIAYDKFLHLFF